MRSLTLQPVRSEYLSADFGAPNVDLERVIDDFIFLTFFVGNGMCTRLLVLARPRTLNLATRPVCYRLPSCAPLGGDR